MKTISSSDFRRNLKKYLDKVIETNEPLIIKRGKDAGVVIISLTEYNSIGATFHELSSVVNVQRLDSAISKFKNGSSFQKDLIEE